MEKESMKQNENAGEQTIKRSIFNNAEINSSLRTANLIIFFGFMLAGFFGLYFMRRFNTHALNTLESIFLPAVFILGSFMFFNGYYMIGKIKKIGVYMTVIVPDQPIAINEVALKTKKNELAVRKDFDMFFKNNYLYGFIDETKNEIVLTAGKRQ